MLTITNFIKILLILIASFFLVATAQADVPTCQTKIAITFNNIPDNLLASPTTFHRIIYSTDGTIISPPTEETLLTKGLTIGDMVGIDLKTDHFYYIMLVFTSQKGLSSSYYLTPAFSAADLCKKEDGRFRQLQFLEPDFHFSPTKR